MEAARVSKAREQIRQKFTLGDLIAGLSVALVLVPQSLAYAELAGLPAAYGLLAAAAAPLAAAFFASSPFLQTGPTALTALLTLGVLSSSFVVGSPEFIAAAAPLALLVGLIRVALGVAGLGGLAYFLSQPVLKGFTTGAAVLILLSQLPTAVGRPAGGRGVLGGAADALSSPGSWNLSACSLALLTLFVVLGGRRVSARFPGVLIAVAVGVGAGWWSIGGPNVGNAGTALPSFFSALTGFSWAAFPSLFLGAATIAVVGFAEPAAIARTFAGEQPGRWNPNRELVSQGAPTSPPGSSVPFRSAGRFRARHLTNWQARQAAGADLSPGWAR